jgi:hypothetical protein
MPCGGFRALCVRQLKRQQVDDHLHRGEQDNYRRRSTLRPLLACEPMVEKHTGELY